MKKKTINAVISKKVKEWIDSITDEALQKSVKDKVIVTGGCIASMLLREEPKDFDIYFTDKATVKAIAQYYIDKYKTTHPESPMFLMDGANLENIEREKDRNGSFIFMNMTPDRIKIITPSSGVTAEKKEVLDEPFEDYFDTVSKADELSEDSLEEADDGKERYRPIFFSSNAITLSNKVQLVIRFYGSPEEIHTNYDFIHCTNYWTYKTGTVLNQSALESLLTKELIYMGSKYPVCSVIRTRKYINRGWTINAGQYIKMLFQVSELDLSRVEVLEDQLIGVDSAYFTHLIDVLQSKQKEDSSFVITSGYLATLVDKIF
jgi:hypothetical protein